MSFDYQNKFKMFINLTSGKYSCVIREDVYVFSIEFQERL